jgi:hypothetical protein
VPTRNLRIDFGTGRSEILMARQTHLFSFSPAAAAAEQQQQQQRASS